MTTSTMTFSNDNTMQSKHQNLNPSIALSRACKVLTHKLRIEFDRKTLINRVNQCEDLERAARRAHIDAEKAVKDAEEALKNAEKALKEAKEKAQELVEPLHKAVAETDKVKRELSMINAELKRCDAEFAAEQQVLDESYKEAVAMSNLVMQAMHSLPVETVPEPTVRYPTVNGKDLPQSHSVANSVIDPPTPTAAHVAVAQRAEDDEPKKPALEERSDKFIDALGDLMIDAPGEVYIDGRTYFLVGDLTRIFSPDLKDYYKSGSAHARKYGTLEGGVYKEGVRKQAGRWIMTLEAFEAYVLPHLRSVRFIKY
ncbi:hypothetical protein BCR44DRAFT_86392 [Catenaria anguillulae PL171]|uniref:Uncharacterized protein n=1 Tax=Catenaria anguillulae PL171 TaxID=765915 RepID=A0A1Y2HVK7_9FUNG|nr:hypothetical protein BCR44DRAFT_86392 [Catenaria anguillulae PL171]